MQDEPGYQPFTDGWASFMEAQAHSYAGRVDQWLEICTLLANQTGAAHLAGLCGLMDVLPNLGRSGDAIALTDDLMTAARASANPFWIAYAYDGCGRAYTESDPQRALDNFRDGLAYTRQHRLPLFEAAIAMSSAWLEAVHGDLDEALDLFTTSLDSFHQSGNTTDLDLTFAYLMVFFDRIEQPEVAATLSGTFVDKPDSLVYASFVTHVDRCSQDARHRHLRQLCPHRSSNDQHRSRPLRPPSDRQSPDNTQPETRRHAGGITHACHIRAVWGAGF